MKALYLSILILWVLPTEALTQVPRLNVVYEWHGYDESIAGCDSSASLNVHRLVFLDSTKFIYGAYCFDSNGLDRWNYSTSGYYHREGSEIILTSAEGDSLFQDFQSPFDISHALIPDDGDFWDIVGELYDFRLILQLQKDQLKLGNSILNPIGTFNSAHPYPIVEGK